MERGKMGEREKFPLERNTSARALISIQTAFKVLEGIHGRQHTGRTHLSFLPQILFNFFFFSMVDSLNKEKRTRKITARDYALQKAKDKYVEEEERGKPHRLFAA